jgi:serine/threonine protein phosphatase PrpC
MPPKSHYAVTLSPHLRVSVSIRKGNQRETNEDRIVIDSFDDVHVICLGDGHAGHKTVNYVMKHLVPILKRTRIPKTRQWLKAAFAQLHEETKHMRDGTTISLLLVVGKDIWLAYMGDSSVMGISIQEHKIQRLTTDHKPHLKKEQAKLRHRITKSKTVI